MGSSTQYDAIGKSYDGMKKLLAAQAERPSAEKELGSLRGLRVLDLACGTGRWTRQLAAAGAAEVIGVDISTTMVEAARNDYGKHDNITYHVGDCTKPLVDASGKPLFEGQVDLVFAAWLLNYAANGAIMEVMWRTITSSLKLGGRFVGIVPNYDIDWAASNPLPEEYGFEFHKVADVNKGQWDQGAKVRMKALVEPPVEFEAYLLSKTVVEETATKAGMKDIIWHNPTYPEDDKNRELWEIYASKPHFKILTATYG